MALKNNYLLIDLGNTCVKAAVYTKMTNQIVESQTASNKTPANDLLKMLKNQSKIEQVIASVTARKEISEPFFADLKKNLNVDIKIINQNDFSRSLDLSNIDKKVKVGTDILLSAYYGTKIASRGLVMSLGSIYYAIYFANRQIVTVAFVPSIVKGLETVAQYGMIDKESIPEVFDKTKGLNTKDAFAAGANLLIEGAADAALQTYTLTSDNIFVTGGDAPRYVNLVKKYRYCPTLILEAMIMLLKEKSW